MRLCLAVDPTVSTTKGEHNLNFEDSHQNVVIEDTDVSGSIHPSGELIGCEKCHENNCHDKMLLCDNNCGRGKILGNFLVVP